MRDKLSDADVASGNKWPRHIASSFINYGVSDKQPRRHMSSSGALFDYD